MRKIFNLLAAVIFSVTIVSCSGPSFNTINSMNNINGTVYLKDGKEMNGLLSTTLNNSFNKNNYIQFSENGKEKKKISIQEIKAISVRNNYYEPKLIDQGSWSSDQLLFVKRITKDGSRIQLYELMEQRTRDNYNRNNRYNTGSSQVVDEYSYYVSLPGQDAYQAWNVEGKHFTPNFENKMSDYVKDCPALAEKIQRKDKGYFYAQVSFISEKRIETLMNIIEEYNRCK